jgi:NAD(P)H-flavin reductase
VTDDRDPMLPTPYRIAHRQVETHDSITLSLEPVDAPLPLFRPGQFTMMYARGVGEIAISISGDPSRSDDVLTQTIRDVGAVSRALHDATIGTVIGVRGPFGAGWDLDSAVDRDLIIVAGGVGLAPLRPVVLGALARRDAYRRIVLVAGARNPDDFLFRAQLDGWAATAGLEVHLTVDQPAKGWAGPVGFVTQPLARLSLDTRSTTAFLCGPEPMMRFSANMLMDRGINPVDIRISVERNMKCGIGWCGHCQLGPLFICRDGPVLDYRRARALLAVGEL